MQDGIEDLALVGKLYKAMSEVMLLRNQIEAKNAELLRVSGELSAARSEIESMKRGKNDSDNR